MPLARIYRFPHPARNGAVRGTHSFVDQSLHSRLGAETTNGDGFGVGWYGAPDTPGVFHSTEPAWNDCNLRELAGHISSPLFFTHIRAAIGSAVQQTNCHPFRHDRWLFMHNGYINESATIKRDLIFAVDPSLYPHIQGQADTEVLFFLALTLGLQDDPPAAVEQAIGLIEAVAAHDRHNRRREHLGLPLLQRAQIPHALLHHRRADPTQATARTRAAERILGQCAAGRIRAPRRRDRRLERGPRIHVRHRRARPRRDATIPTHSTVDIRARCRVKKRRHLHARSGLGRVLIAEVRTWTLAQRRRSRPVSVPTVSIHRSTVERDELARAGRVHSGDDLRLGVVDTFELGSRSNHVRRAPGSTALPCC